MNWQKVKQDLLLATFAEITYKVVGYLVIVMLARYLDKGQMGQFFFAITLATFFVPFANLGTDQYLIRAVAEAPEWALAYFSEVISLRLPLLALYLVIINGFTLIFKPELTVIMLFTSAFSLLENFFSSFGALFIGLKRVSYKVAAGLSAKLLLVGLVFAAINLGGSLNIIFWSYILANTALVAYAVYLVWRKIGPFQIVWHPEAMRRVVQQSLPLFSLSILAVIHLKIDTLMLGFLQPYAAVATYEAGFKLLEISRFAVRPAGLIFFPICAGMAARQNWPAIRSLAGKMFLVTGGLGGGVALGMLVLAGLIMPLLFGSKYDDSIPLLKVLYLSVPALYMGMVSTFLANALHLEKKVVKILLIGIVINIGLNLLVIPRWGGLGAAWTTVISEFLRTAWLMILIWVELRKRSAGEITRPGSAPRPEPVLTPGYDLPRQESKV